MKIYNFIEATASFNLPAQEAIKHFQCKGLKTSFDWRDMLGEEHDAAFVERGAAHVHGGAQR